MQHRVPTALFWGAVCVCALLAIVGQVQAACPPDRIDAQAQVAEVYDGDTVRLADDRTLRLIGFNAPELGRNGQPSQPFARQATDALDALLAQHNYKVLMRHDVERRDNYGRWLAHLYLPDKTSITAHVLRAGLATHLAVPPDVFNVDCYQRAESQARTAKLGVWSLPQYQVIASTRLGRDARGFRRVHGTVVRVGNSRRAVWLNLEGNVALRIDREDLSNFANRSFDHFKGKQVTARGWLYAHNGELRMQIRHPAAFDSESPR